MASKQLPRGQGLPRGWRHTWLLLLIEQWGISIEIHNSGKRVTMEGAMLDDDCFRQGGVAMGRHHVPGFSTP
jgi:hypothetical protein